MIQKRRQASVPASARIRAEAAAWIARLHGPDRTAADERGFQQWLKASEAHERTFEQMTDVWEAGARLKSDTLAQARRGNRFRPKSTFARMGLATAALAIIATVATTFFFRDAAIVTEVGEQRIQTLKDGTRITLNTATRLKVRYDNKQRRIFLERGEALFEVAKRPDWPFVVSTGEKEVTALGTTFVVRQNPHQTAVTLLEGKVEVTTHGSGASRPELLQQHASSPSTQSAISADAVILAAGQRVTFEGGEAPKLDKPSLEKVTAWKKGLVELDKTPLIDAVAEMNRYSVVPVVLQEPHEINVRVSGVFRAGDSLEFARAVAQAYGLSFVEQPDAFVLSRSR